MATFQERVEDLIGSVSNTQLISDSLTDTAAELINYFPAQWLWLVSKNSGDQTSNGYAVTTNKIVSVTRENGTNGEYVECRQVPLALESKVVDSRSLFYPSKSEPVYLLKSGGVHVYPTPSSSPNAFQVAFVEYPSIVAGDSAIPEGGDSIKFPNDVEYLVVLGAARKCLIGLMATVQNTLTSITPTVAFITPQLPTEPESPSGSTIIIPASPPPYTMPAIDAISGDSDELTASIADLASDSALGNQTDFTDYKTWFTALGSMIEDHEDVELAQAQTQKIQTFLSAYSNAMQNRLNKFNESNTEYQAQLQKAIQQSRHDDTKYANKLGLYQAQMARYAAEVNKEVSKHNTSLQKYGQDLQRYNSEYQWYSDQFNKLDSDYKNGIQNINKGLSAK